MDWRDTPEQAAFRAEAREFLRQRFPATYRPADEGEVSIEPEDVPGFSWAADRRSDDPERRAAAAAWASVLAARGWIAPHWPTAYGGAGLPEISAFILQEEMMRARVPSVNGIGVYLLGPTLMEFGSEAQRRQHLPRISDGTVAWAQGFSEPDAGSDLASLRTRAVLDGATYVVNGQKTWTSQAQFADWMFALVRTDPEARPRHRGLTYLLIDLHSPGVSVRPIRDMRGSAPFAEVFLEDVRVPVGERVGEENRGWYVAMRTLECERSAIGPVIRYEQALAQLIACVRDPEGQGYLRGDWRNALRHEIAERYIEIRVLYNLALHTVSRQAAGEAPGYESSVIQLLGAELHQRLALTGARFFGPYGQLSGRREAPLDALFTHDLVDAIPASFMGGTTEIQRNVIATRGLGLPRQ